MATDSPGPRGFSRHRAAAAFALGFWAASAMAEGLVLSGFGTLGYARSNSPQAYERSIDNGGTFRRDSVLGLQGDLPLGPRWSATVQLKASQAEDSDRKVDLKTTWAFGAWRPDNDWLVRAGRMRLPLFLYSESLEVGATYDAARLPAEMYSIGIASDYDGFATARSWALDDGDLTADLYVGRVRAHARIVHPAGPAPGGGPSADFVGMDARMRGLVLTWRTAASVMRLSLHHVRSRIDTGPIPTDFPFVAIPGVPGAGYYQVDNRVPGPGVTTSETLSTYYLSAGLDQPIGRGVRLTAEAYATRQPHTNLPSDQQGGYAAISREFGAFTPYLSIGRIRPSNRSRDQYLRLTQTRLPAFIPGADQINMSMLMAASTMFLVDQRSLAVGTSYRPGGHQTIKVAYQRTHIGLTSRLFDAPLLDGASHRTIGIWSASYSFTF